MRNTKVIDIIEELKVFGANVDVYDPWVDIEAEEKWYKHGIIENPLESDKKIRCSCRRCSAQTVSNSFQLRITPNSQNKHR